MKLTCLVVFMVLFYEYSTAQIMIGLALSGTGAPKYMLNKPMTVKQEEITNSQLRSNVNGDITLPKGTTFTYLGRRGTDRVYGVESVGGSGSVSTKEATYVRSAKGNRYGYTLSNSTRKAYCVQIPTLSVLGGIFSLPFKCRPQDGTSFEPSLSLGFAGGPCLKWTKENAEVTCLGLLFGFSGTSIQLKPSTAGLNSGITENTNRPAATLSSTLLLKVGKIQFVVSCGTDFNLDNSKDAWRYHGDIWYSGGVGFSLFTEQAEPAE